MNNKNHVVDRSLEAVNSRKALSIIHTGAQLMIALCGIAQIVFFFEVQYNVSSVFLTWLSAIVTFYYCLRPYRFSRSPISCLLLLGFNFVSLSGALVAMTISGVSLVAYLLTPGNTFWYLFIAQATLIFSHFIYESFDVFSRISVGMREKILKPLGAFKLPSTLQLWVMGFLGCVAVLSTRAGSFAEEKSFAGDDVGAKALAGFTFLLAAPFLMPVLKYFNTEQGISRRSHGTSLSIYFAIVVIVGSMANTRSVFADAIATLGLSMMVIFSLGRIQVNKSTAIRIALVLLLIILALPLVSRIATAMVLVREARDSVSGADLFMLSIKMFFDGDRISSFAEESKLSMLGEYSEFYINNPLLARLIITKFHDNMFYFSQSYLGSDVELLWVHMLDRILMYLPQPIIDILGFGVNKSDYIFSNGDYMFYLATGYGLGGYRTGSMIAEGFALYGNLFPFALIMLAIGCFIVYDSFYDGSRNVSVPISPIILLQIWYLFGGVAGSTFGAEGVSKVVGGLIRGVPQFVLIYLSVVFVVSLMAGSKLKEMRR